MRVIHEYSKSLTGYVIMPSTCTRPAWDWAHCHSDPKEGRTHEAPPFPEYMHAVNDCWKKETFFFLASTKLPMLL